MTPPDKCPRCESLLKEGWENVYQCSSVFNLPGGNVLPGLEERGHCFHRQRDALAARVKELEEVGDEVLRLLKFEIGELPTGYQMEVMRKWNKSKEKP